MKLNKNRTYRKNCKQNQLTQLNISQKL